MGRISSGIAVLTAKIGTKMLPIAAKLAKFVKVGKVGLGVVSMISYAYLFTWQFAIMLMISLFVHESGHIWAMKRCGLKTKGIYFIPFIGAAAVTEDTFKTRRDEAYIAIMGPIWGFILAGIVVIIYIKTGNPLFAAAAGWMAMINLFNLLPINPLDGGRVVKSITFSINSRLGFIFMITGIIASILLTFWAGIALFVFLLIIACFEFIFEYKVQNEDQVIKRCVKDLDKIIDDDNPYSMTNAAKSVKGMLLDEKEKPLDRIKKVISIGKDINSIRADNAKIEFYHIKVISHILLPRLKWCDPIPKMTVKGTIITAIVYIGIAVILWILMTWMNHIPEVEIARKLFMS